jgi:predicted nicotinamide N-methyase
MTNTLPDSATRTPFLTIHSTPIYFSENWNAGIGGGLWSTGLAMARYLATQLPSSCLNERNILELGSGNGLLAVCVLAACNSGGKLSQLVVTDTGQLHLDCIRATLAANAHVSQQATVTVVEHKWGEFCAVDKRDTSIQARVQQGTVKFDIILGSDVAYRPELYDPLIASLQAYSHADTVCLIGVTMKDTTVDFFVKLQQAGFCYQRLADSLLDEEFRGVDFGIFVMQRRAKKPLLQYKSR